MAIFNLFSKRKADAAKSGDADVYQYAEIPLNVRVQIKQISLEAIGRVGARGDRIMTGDRENNIWVEVESVFLREKGLESIGREYFSGDRVLSFMSRCSTEDWLDLLELIAMGIQIMGVQKYRQERSTWQVTTSSDEAIDEINCRMREGGIGYQIEDNFLIRIDSHFLHAEVVKPALLLLSEENFEGPRQEFLVAHQHYRAGEYRQAVAMAANALESTFKAVFDEKHWTYQNGARISDLVKIARANGLWPEYLDSSFDQLIATLQSGLPKIRNNSASHGQGAKAVEVPDYIAAYALHLAASKIVFIANAAKG